METILASVKSAQYELSPLDIIASHLYLTNVFFFENTQQWNNFMTEDALKLSLYDALQDFPILLGKLCHGRLNSMQITVDSGHLNLPLWEYSQCPTPFDTLKRHGFDRDYWPAGINITEPQMRHGSGQGSQLLRVHMVRFANNSGIAIVLRIAHAAVDAKGFVAFANHWARHCRSRSADPDQKANTAACHRPLIDRDVMYMQLPPDVRPRNLHWLLWPVSLIAGAMVAVLGYFLKSSLTAGKTSSHLFRVCKDKLDRIKALAASSSGSSISHNDILTALFTMAYAQSTMAMARRSVLSRRPSTVSAIVPCDFRHRLQVAEEYTGNCAIGLFVTVPVEMLLRPATDENLVQVALVSRRTTAQADRSTIEQFLRRAIRAIRLLGGKVRIMYSLMICQAFSNQSRLPFYESDFGHGKPVFVAPTAYSRTLAVIVPPPPPSRDAFVYLSLEAEQMAHVRGNESFMSVADVVY